MEYAEPDGHHQKREKLNFQYFFASFYNNIVFLILQLITVSPISYILNPNFGRGVNLFK